MVRVIAVFLLLFTSAAYAEVQVKVYQFGECQGHETICDDEFKERIVLRVVDGVPITTEVQFQHPHIIEISQSKMTMNDSGFTSAHTILNNLGNEFRFHISGDAKAAEAKEVIIHLGEEQLASITLTAMKTKTGDIEN